LTYQEHRHSKEAPRNAKAFNFLLYHAEFLAEGGAFGFSTGDGAKQDEFDCTNLAYAVEESLDQTSSVVHLHGLGGVWFGNPKAVNTLLVLSDLRTDNEHDLVVTTYLQGSHAEVLVLEVQVDDLHALLTLKLLYFLAIVCAQANDVAISVWHSEQIANNRQSDVAASTSNENDRLVVHFEGVEERVEKFVLIV
jgi:hypothetical protein